VYQVQVAAVSTRSAADEIAARVRASGVTTDVVHEGKFYKVRAGSYQTRSEAEAGVAQLKARLGGQPFIVHAP
jgi:cell division septation protein DedD